MKPIKVIHLNPVPNDKFVSLKFKSSEFGHEQVVNLDLKTATSLADQLQSVVKGDLQC